jgi:hypothetical protein
MLPYLLSKGQGFNAPSRSISIGHLNYVFGGLSRAKRLFCQCLDGCGSGDKLPGLLEVEQFGHFAVDNNHALTGIDRIPERGDDCLGFGKGLCLRGKDAVGGFYLHRMD